MRELACVSDLVLDQLWAGELHEARAVELRGHAAQCARCSARLAEYEAFLQTAPTFGAHAAQLGLTPQGPHPAPTSVRQAARAPGERRLLRSWLRSALWLGGGLASCAAALLWLSRPEGAAPHVRSKGAPHVDYFIKRDGHVSTGRSGQRLRAGDLLRFTVSSDRPRYLALIDRDPQGARIFYPAGSHAARVGAGNAVALDFSVELDDSVGAERIYAVFCAEPFALEPLRAELSARGELRAPPGCTIDVTEIDKEAP